MLVAGDRITPRKFEGLVTESISHVRTIFPVILADNFVLGAGKAEITVPWVQTREDYSLVCE